MDISAWGLEINPTLLLVIAFVIGVSLRFFARASKAFHSTIRAYPSKWAFVKTNWDVFLVRALFFDTPIFCLWIFKPDLITSALKGINIPDNIANWIIIAPTPLSSFGFGGFVDLAVDQIQMRLTTNPPSWLPDVLKGEIPCYIQSVDNIVKTMAANGNNGGQDKDKGI